jgi:hypothetical protein
LKLLKLKEWLTLPDAAKHLSLVVEEEVSEADVLRLALDGHLTLSFDFVNHARGVPGLIVSREVARRTLELSDQTVFCFEGEELSDGQFWQGKNEIKIVEGVWDLTMLGAERLDVEHRYQLLTGGPPVGLVYPGGPFITKDGIGCNLRTHYTVESPKVRDWNDPINYYPAAGLPSDGTLVVRISALKELEARLGESNTPPEKPLELRERTTLLVMIAALAKLSGIDLKKPSSAAVSIERQTELMGARVAARTIENHLNRIYEAMESRSVG